MKYVLTQTNAPFTLEQTLALNAYQRSAAFHPFTCPHQDNDRHPGSETRLIATREGWRCPHCAYAQQWAHTFMTQPACEQCGAYQEPLEVRDDLTFSCRPCSEQA